MNLNQVTIPSIDLERSVHYGMSEHIQTMEKDLSRTNLNTLGNDSVNYDAITV